MVSSQVTPRAASTGVGACHKVRKFLVASLAALVAFAVLPMQAASAATTITGGGAFDYTEQEPAVPIGGGISITEGTSYAGEYIEFEVSEASDHDVLSVATVATPNTSAGVVSIVGSAVYLGNGTIAEPIGSVDATFDGQAGRKLRVNFTTEFTNPGFETGDQLGWTALEQRIDLGTTTIAGFVANDTSTYPSTAPNRDNNEPANASYTVETTTDGQPTEGAYALRLQSNMTTAVSCDVVHGPAVYSGEFEAAAGDKIYFDWRAFAGSDAYHVFGYIVDRNGNQTEVLDAYTNDAAGSTNWATKETVIPTGGDYRFVFVAGTFDATCGRAAGAQLLIDNVRVFGTKANDDVAEQIAHLLHYANTSDDPPLERTVTVTAKSNSNGTGTDTITVNITPVDDAPTLAAIDTVTFTNTTLDDEFSSYAGTFGVSDPDDDVFTFEMNGIHEFPTEIDGVAYTHRNTISLWTVYLNDATGDYLVVPDNAALNYRDTGGSVTYTVTVTASGQSAQQFFDVEVVIDRSLASAPTDLSATPGDGFAALEWGEPDWAGHSAITSYRVEVSADGGDSWLVVAAEADPAEMTATVTGLTNGTEYTFRVAPINDAGVGVPSSAATATPRTVPDAPTALNVVEDDTELHVSWTAPVFDGGTAITGYEVSTDRGSTWSAYGADTTSVTVDELTNGTAYEVFVRAVNAAGSGPASTAVQGTPRTVPGVPGGLIVVEDDTSLHVTWNAPATDGGAAITGYEVSLDGGATWSAYGADTTLVTVDELTNGTTYQVQVRALNEAGSSAATTAVEGTPRTVPDAPADMTVVPGDESLIVSWNPPAFDGGAAITGYELSLDGGATWTSVDADTTSVTLEDLSNGTEYAVQVRARNEAGASATADAANTPRTVADAPTALRVVEDDTALRISWTASVGDGGAAITGYEVSLDGGMTWTSVDADTTSVTVDELTNGIAYEVQVRAVNAAGPSAATTAVEGTPRTVPGIPADLSVTEGDRSLRIDFTAPADNGAAITDYEVSLDGGATWTGYGPDTSIVVDELTNGTVYEVLVRAVNEAGAGPATGAVEVAPRTVASAPTALSVVEDDSALHLSWNAPVADGGATLTGYEVSLDGGATWIAYGADSTSVTVDELTNGTQYQVQVRALNEAGSSAATATVDGTPRTVPDAPVVTGIVAANRELRVSFDAPDDNGADITSYQVSLDNGVTWSATFVADDVSGTIRLFGLTNGTTYPVQIRAINEAGTGPASDPLAATPVQAPVPGADGELSVTPGKARVMVNGEEADVVITAEPDGRWTMTGDGWKVTLDGLNSDGSAMTTDSQGRLVVVEGGAVRVTGEGFMPHTIVDVWMFSTPTMLGEVRVGADGSFDELLSLPDGIKAGEHTVELNGLGADGATRSAATGLIVQALPDLGAGGTLPFTGSEALGMARSAALLLAAGALLLAATRRRRSADDHAG